MHHAKHFGEYNCKAKNILGAVNYTIYIQEGIQPETPHKFELLGKGNDSLEFYLGSRDDDTNESMKINRYRFEMMTKENFEYNESEWKYQNIRDMPAEKNSTYLIEKLQPNTTYLIRVASINAAGLSEWTEIEEFTTLAHAPKKIANNAALTNTSLLLLFLFYYLSTSL